MENLEILAIKNLEKAFAKCSKLGIQFCGMDGTLLFATETALNNIKKIKNTNREFSGDYCLVARCVNFHKTQLESGEINTSGSYMDSGGW